jgi:hypothetical protein
MESEVKVNGGAEFVQGEQAALIKSNGHLPARSRRSETVETFTWRPLGEGKAPVSIKVYPYLLCEGDNTAMEHLVSRKDAEVEALIDQEAALIKKRGQFETALFLDRLEGKSLDPEDNQNAANMVLLDARLADIRQRIADTPSSWGIRARDFFCPVIADTSITIDDVTIEVTPEGFSRLDPAMLKHFYKELTGFFYGEKRLNRK